MISVAIDPTEMRGPVATTRPKAAPSSSHIGRTLLMAGLGAIGIACLSAGAYAMLSGLAGPQLAKPRVAQHVASNWPDLKDGVPALAPMPGETKFSDTRQVDARPVNAKPVEAASSSPVIEAPAPRLLASLSPTPPPVASPSAARVAVQPAQPPVETPLARAPAPRRLPAIETVLTVPAAKPVTLVAARTGALVGPSAAETTRARATSGTFAALPPDPVVARKKPSIPVARARARTAPATEANAEAPAAAAAEAEPETNEVFGMKVPSLAPAGRKFVEGVEAFGNAVKNLPNQF